MAALPPRSCTRPRSRRAPSPCPEVGEDLPDRAPAQRGHARIGLAVVGDEHYRLVQGDAAGPVPGAVTVAEGVAVLLPPGRPEHGPGGDQVRGGISGAGRAPV